MVKSIPVTFLLKNHILCVENIICVHFPSMTFSSNSCLYAHRMKIMKKFGTGAFSICFMDESCKHVSFFSISVRIL